MLSLEDVRRLKEGNLIEVGAHTMSHLQLSAHSTTVQREEIVRSKARVEELSDAPVTSFAYPFGNFSPETIPLLREAGFSIACSTISDVVWRKSDSFRLPRWEVQNWDGEEFGRHLRTWLNG